MADLLARDTFDTFVLGEAQITTFTTFRIDGTWHPVYFSQDRPAAGSSAAGSAPGRTGSSAAGSASDRAGFSASAFTSAHGLSGPASAESAPPTQPAITTSRPNEEPSWKRVRPHVFDMIRGKNTPLSFKVVFKLAGHNVESLLKMSGVSFSPEQVDGLFLNISYQNNEVTCTSGTSMKTFTLDRSLDRVWDEMVLKFFSSRRIPVERL